MNKKINLPDQEFLDDIKFLISNIPSIMNHTQMSNETKIEISAIKEEIKTLRIETRSLKEETEKGNAIDIKIEQQMKNQTQTLKEIRESLKSDYVTKSEFILEKKNMEDKISLNAQSIKSIRYFGYTILVAVIIDIVLKLINQT